MMFKKLKYDMATKNLKFAKFTDCKYKSITMRRKYRALLSILSNGETT